MTGRERRGWIRNAVGWDGALPVLVVLSSEVLSLTLVGRDRDLGTTVSTVVVPPVAALIRAHRGGQQLRKVCPDHPAWGRQFLFGLAIIVLLAFEVLLAALQWGRVASPWPWLSAAGMYLVYLALVMTALRPPGGRGNAGTPGSR